MRALSFVAVVCVVLLSLLLSVCKVKLCLAGMVYTEPEQMGWQPLFTSWLCRQEHLANGASEVIQSMAGWLFDPALAFVRQNCTEVVATSDVNLAWASLQLLEAFLTASDPAQLAGRQGAATLQGLVVMAVLWGFGGALSGQVCPLAPAWRCRGKVSRSFWCQVSQTRAGTTSFRSLLAQAALSGRRLLA